MNLYYIDGHSLTLESIRTMINDPDAVAVLSEEAERECRRSRGQIERWMEKDAPVVYGVNTGLGNLKDVVVPPEKHIEWNKTLPYPHAAGMGDYLPPEVTLTSLLLRANVLARAYSGVRPELINRILSVYNAKIAPAVHSEGSTGLSDLGPLAQNVMTAGSQHLPLNPKQNVKHKLWRHSGHKPYPFLAHASVSGIVEQGQCGFSQNVHTQRRVVFSGSRRVFSKYYV